MYFEGESYNQEVVAQKVLCWLPITLISRFLQNTQKSQDLIQFIGIESVFQYLGGKQLYVPLYFGRYSERLQWMLYETSQSDWRG